jgi:hypothetical protein
MTALRVVLEWAGFVVGLFVLAGAAGYSAALAVLTAAGL